MAEPFIFPNGQLAYSVEDLKKICQEFPQDSINYLVRGDFENWLNYIGETKVAQQAREARQANLNDTERLQKFLTTPQPSPKVPPDVKPTQVQQTVPKAAQKSPEDDNPLAKFFQGLAKLFGG